MAQSLAQAPNRDHSTHMLHWESIFTSPDGVALLIEEARSATDVVFAHLPTLDDALPVRFAEMLSFLGLVPSADFHCMLGDGAAGIGDAKSARGEGSGFAEAISALMEDDACRIRCLYDHQGALPSIIPAHVVSISYGSNKFNPWDIAWDEDWLFDELMGKGEQVAEEIAHKIPKAVIARATGVLASWLDRHGCGHLRDNFDALACHSVGFPMDEQELARALGLLEEKRRSRRASSPDLSLMQMEPLLPISAKLLGVLGDDEGLLELCQKAIHARDLARAMIDLWHHALDSAGAPVKWTSMLGDEKLSMRTTHAIGEVLGVPSLIEAYLRGVPLSDIIA